MRFTEETRRDLPKVFRFGLENIPPATLGLVGLNVVVWINPSGLDLGRTSDACLLPALVVDNFELKRLILSAFHHLSDMHLYYNMSSLLYKGRTLELSLGTDRFLTMVAKLVPVTSVIHVVLAAILRIFGYDSAWTTCAAGFSGVLFGMKMVLQHSQGGTVSFYSISVPAPESLMYWTEMLLLQFFMPGISIVGHVAGAVAGSLYASGLLDSAIAAPFRAPGPPRRRYNDQVGRAMNSPEEPRGRSAADGINDHRSSSSDREGGFDGAAAVRASASAPLDLNAMRRRRLDRFGASADDAVTPGAFAGRPRFNFSGTSGRRADQI